MDRWRWLAPALVVLARALGPAPAGGEEIRNLVAQRPAGAALGGHVVFSWTRPQGGAAGHAVIAVTAGALQSHDLRAAWGVWTEGGLQAGAVDGPTFHQLYTGSEGSHTVQVSPEQLTQALSLLERGATQNAKAPPPQACDNVAYSLMSALELKAPYRGGFAPADPFATFRDLTRINRTPRGAAAPPREPGGAPGAGLR